jgi:hypothetical protein
MIDWTASPTTKKKKDGVRRILTNRREALKDKGIGSEDRYHYLPGVWDIPHLVVDFQALEHVQLTTLKAMTCLAALASPFAESLAARFGRYISRFGTPDLNIDAVLTSLQS